MNTDQHDKLHRFVFESAPVRGAVVHLDESWIQVVARFPYPSRLRELLGELLAAGVLLSANLKFDGTLFLQLQGEGPLKLMVVECHSDRTLRATAKWHGTIGEHASLASLLGYGQFVVTLDPKNGSSPYQGVVALEGRTVAEMLMHYMRRSEQLDTFIRVEASANCVAGLLLQRLPDGHGDVDGWPRTQQLAATLTRDEVLTLPAETVCHRLFHEEDLRLFAPETVSFSCSCSRERVGEILRMIGVDEVASILAEQGSVEVACDYCSQRYVFDEDDAEHLFIETSDDDVPPVTH